MPDIDGAGCGSQPIRQQAGCAGRPFAVTRARNVSGIRFTQKRSCTSGNAYQFLDEIGCAREVAKTVYPGREGMTGRM